MAARNYSSNRLFNWHLYPVHLDAQVTIGASGDPTLVTSTTIPGSSPSATTKQSRGIKSITRLATGTYRIQLDDNFSSLLDFKASFTSAVTGSEIAVDATTAGLTVGVAYQITTVGTATTAANYVTLGLPAGQTAALGQVFVAATTGTGTQSGAGKVKALANQSTGMQAQILGDPNTMLNSQPFVQGNGGGYITFQTMGSTVAATFTGSALATHNHNLTVIGGQAGSTTNDIANYAGPLLGKQEASNATYIGANSATSGGVVGAGAGTPAGTIAGTVASAPADPTDGCTMYLRILLSNSSIQ